MRAVLAVLLLTACGSSSGNNDDGGGGSNVDAATMTADANVKGSSAISIIVEPDGNDAAQLVSAINAATTAVNMTMYEISHDGIIAALVNRAKAGVTVRCVLDSSSTNKSFNTDAYNQINTAGGHCIWSNTAFTYTHEKSIMIDGTSAWIMTMNATASAPNENREYLALDTDAADVAEANAVFEADFALHSITPSGQLVVANSNARADLVALINAATTTLDIEGEEWSDTYTGGLIDSTVAAAGRGVKVRLIVGNSGNATAPMQRVKTAGGKVVVTGPASGAGTKTNPYIHAKTIVIDCSGTTCARGYVGSENFTAGSLGYNRELGVIFTQTAELAKVEAAISTDFAAGVAQ